MIGVPDEKWGERPIAVVVLHEEFRGKVTEQDIKDFYQRFVEKGIIPKYGVPNRVEFVDTIPKTSVGKISKKDLRNMYAGG